ncbi:alpha/beta hydrolase [Pseudanabaena sp. FACHB-2040]|uniref:alpha/beta hydrolase n=1 Tax=Pseudanabaena sp. FACHB-2040 TaxID=2692859 RepID=UPI001683148A|nr:alpha/beta hydrolase [Pseudanabaena sp. FACHB-2040]MBD2260450.1 alpha/beta hydrolase [Pseudanabaena sp. FACHB-2040]
MVLRNRWLRYGFAIATLPVGILAAIRPLPSWSAERVVVSYRLFEFSISVSSLEAFAYEGTVDSELQAYARYLPEDQLTQIRQFLIQPIPLSPVEIGQLTYSSFGEETLRFFGDTIQTGARQNGFSGLRGALILAAAEPEGLTPLNVIRQFPTSTLRVDASYAQHIVGQFNQLFDRNHQAMTLIAQLANQEMTDFEAMTTSSLSELGEIAWNKEVLMLFDELRQRRILVDFYQPLTTSPAPVIVFSHGLAASRTDLIELAEHLASHGFAVAVVEHPNSNTEQVQNLLRGLAREVTEPSEFIERPRDITFLLDELQTRNQFGPRRNRLNLRQIGVVGHSFGGYTALALVGASIDFTNLNHICSQTQFSLNMANVSLLLQCSALQLPNVDYELQDERIQAAFVFNPIGSALFGEEGLKHLSTPLLIVAGSDDWVAPPLLEQICPFTWLDSSDKYLALIQGGGHSYDAVSTGQSSLLNELAGADPAVAKRYLKLLSLAFFNTYLERQSEYQLLSNVNYGQHFNQFPLELYLTNALSNAPIAQSLNLACSEITALKL